MIACRASAYVDLITSMELKGRKLSHSKRFLSFSPVSHLRFVAVQRALCRVHVHQRDERFADGFTGRDMNSVLGDFHS